MEWIFLDPAAANFVELLMSLGERCVFLPCTWETSVKFIFWDSVND